MTLLDTVGPHTYSNSLIHKSHRLTLGSPRCPDRWEQKPRGKSREEEEEKEEEEEEVSESQGGEERSAVQCSPGHPTLGAVLDSLGLKLSFFPILLKQDFDPFNVGACVQLWVSDNGL